MNTLTKNDQTKYSDQSKLIAAKISEQCQPREDLCPNCHETFVGERFNDPAGQYAEGICEYCWNRSI